MSTYTTPYCSINGTDFSSIVYSQGVEPAGGELPVEEITYPGRGYADVRTKGRAAKKYKVRARSTDRDAIEAFLKAVNTAPANSKFYPYDASRFGLIASAYAGLKAAPQSWGIGYNFWEAEAEIICREPWLLGADKGLLHFSVLPRQSTALQNVGHAISPISVVRVSGDYFDGHPHDISRGLYSTDVAYFIDDHLYKSWYYVTSPIRFGDVSIKRICSNGSVAYAIGWDGHIYRWSAPMAEWEVYIDDGVLQDISCATDGTIYVVSIDGKLYRRDGNTWKLLGGADIVGVAAIDATRAFVVTDGAGIWQYTGSWYKVSDGDAEDVDAIGTALVALISGVAYWWNGTTFVSLGGANGYRIALRAYAAGNIDLVTITTSGQIWRYTTAGGWVQLTTFPTPAYVEDLRTRIHPSASTIETDRRLYLCDKMMRGDLFEFGWAVPGGARHSYTANLAGTLAVLYYDLHGNVSGGDLTSGILTLDNSDYLMMPFYGPLPVSGEPDAVSITAYVTAYSGSRATVVVATETDLSDLVAIEQDAWTVGWNTVHIPDMAGEDFLAIGIKASSAGSISMSYLKCMVKRYVAPSKIPAAEVDESYKLRIECDSTKGTLLRYGEALVNDRYYY